MRSLGVLLVLLAAMTPLRAQEGTEQEIYAQIEPGARREYEALVANITRSALHDPNIDWRDRRKLLDRVEEEKERLKVMTYNKASLFAHCAAEAQQGRKPGAPRVAPQQNLVLQSCLEIKLSQITKYANVSNYAGVFFPERIAPCGERARLREREQQFRPFAFLQLSSPKLYDFELYTKCMMTPR
jgi:hypothetical protein